MWGKKWVGKEGGGEKMGEKEPKMGQKEHPREM